VIVAIIQNQGRNDMEGFKISTALEEFLCECDIKNSSLSTYSRVLKLYFKYLFIKRLEFNRVKREHIIQYKKYMAELHEPKTVNLYISVVKRFYSWAEMSGLYSNVAKGIKLMRVPHTYKRMPLTIDQVDKLISAIDRDKLTGKRDFVLVNLMVKTGLRRIEVHRLDIGDLIELNGRFALKIQRKGHDGKDQYKVLSTQLFDELTDLICARPKVKNSDPMFISYAPGRKGHRLNTDDISRIIKGYMNGIGLTDDLYSCHSLRHTTAVTLLDAGYDMHYVQMFMGHSSPATTQLYTKVISDRIAFDDKGINSLEKVFKSN